MTNWQLVTVFGGVGLLAIGGTFLLVSAGGDAARRDRAERFMTRCAAVRFAPEQCAFLLTVAEQLRSRQDDDAVMNLAISISHGGIPSH